VGTRFHAVAVFLRDLAAEGGAKVLQAAAFPEVARRRRSAAWRTALAWLLLSPAVLLIVLLVLYPLGYGIYTSMTGNAFLSNQAPFVGLQNYATLVKDPLFWQVVWQTLVWTAVVVAGQFVLGLLSALALNQPVFGRSFWRSASLIPWVMPGVAAGMLWLLIYNPYFGLSANVQHVLGVTRPVAVLSSIHTALPAVILAAIWKGSPFSILMYLAGLQAVDQSVVEAARMDGASWWHQIRHSVLPQMAPVVRVTLLFTAIWTFNYFDMMYVMTNGGPVNSTQIFPVFIFQTAFGQLQFGLGAAVGILSLLVVGVMAGLLVMEQLREGGLD
jgi:multiple sugar transport system permease protein